jgi:hypothetical protein
MANAKARAEWNQSAEAAELHRCGVDAFKRLGLPETAAEAAATGRPVMGVSADDAMFCTFMVFENHAPRLARLLMRWAQRHNLTYQREFQEDSTQPAVYAEGGTETPEFTEVTLHKDYWACEWALFTLWSWKFSSKGAQMMNSDPPEWVHAFEDQSLTSGEPLFRVQPGWDVLSETEPIFRKRVEVALSAYVEGQRRLHEARGFIGSAEKRRLIHFDWLALYQVKRYSWAMIADWDQEQPGETTRAEDVIRKGVNSTANLCGLAVRPGRPGRPKTRK